MGEGLIQATFSLDHHQILVDFEFKGTVEHPLRSGQAELVQGAPRILVFSFSMNLDYILHWWRILPLWP